MGSRWIQAEKGAQAGRDDPEQHSKLCFHQVICAIRWSQHVDVSIAVVGSITEYAGSKLPWNTVRDRAEVKPCFPPDWPEVMQS